MSPTTDQGSNIMIIIIIKSHSTDNLRRELSQCWNSSHS